VVVEVKSKEDFAAWLQAQQAGEAPAAQPAAADPQSDNAAAATTVAREE
jgi:hypothetical protein